MTLRNSRMLLNQVYFWTNTVKDWDHLLSCHKYKSIITDSLKELTDRKLIEIYGFVIMPNHLHILWRLLRKNGKEMPHASFNKATAHLIIKDLKAKHSSRLRRLKVSEPSRAHRIWRRDALAVLMDSKKKFEQKLDYIHMNPLQEKWSLAKRPEWYSWSSAEFYELGKSRFSFLRDYREVFWFPAVRDPRTALISGLWATDRGEEDHSNEIPVRMSELVPVCESQTGVKGEDPQTIHTQLLSLPRGPWLTDHFKLTTHFTTILCIFKILLSPV